MNNRLLVFGILIKAYVSALIILISENNITQKCGETGTSHNSVSWMSSTFKMPAYENCDFDWNMLIVAKCRRIYYFA